jgi:prepilin-type N-terminal cleavage/methylation domain-containing protein
MQRSSRGGEGGFSLIELTVAMAVTLIVTGAIYGLLAGGQSAFRREPELSDRQQNIRVAMDVILRDIANAGSGLPQFMQTFTPGLDACGTCPMGPDGAQTDELEILTNSGALDNLAACIQALPPAPGTGFSGLSHNLHLVRRTSTITPQTPVILMMRDGTWTQRNVVTVGFDAAVAGPPYENCPNNSPHVVLDFGPTGDTAGMNVPNTLCTPSAGGVGNVAGPCDVLEVGFGEVVRYRVQLDAAGVPVLQRSSSANPGAGFQTLARGIEDMQVQYLQAVAGAAWVDGAPLVQNLPPDFGTIIREVQVTLSARSEAQNIQGVTTSTSGPVAVRGTLTATASPRSSLLALSWQPNPAPPAAPINLWR